MTKGIMIIGHGSRYNFNKWIMEEQKRRLEDKGFDNVYIGFNETTYPLVNDTLDEMVSNGVDEIIAIPFFIASGLHITRDIPKKLMLPENSTGGTVSVNGRNVQVRYEPPIGKDPALSDILAERVEELKSENGKTGILVIGHGSRLPYNKETIMYQASRLSGKGYADVNFAFNEFDEPSVQDVFDRMVSSGLDEVIVLPLFISLGAHLKHDIPAKIGLKDGMIEGNIKIDGKTVKVKYALPVGNDPRLTDLIIDKIEGKAKA